MKAAPKFLGLIPARMGSKGIPGKNLKTLDGKPLIRYTIESAMQSELLDELFVSTDSTDVQQLVQTIGGVLCPMLRPASLSTDESPMIDVIRHALEYYDDTELQFDYVVLLQPTAPFRESGLIDRAIRQIVDERADSLISVRTIPPPFNPYWAFQATGTSFGTVMNRPLISRRQDLPPTYYRDGQIYIVKTSLIRSGRIIGGQISALINDSELHVNLDTPADWLQAEKMISKWKNREKTTCL